MNNNIEEKLKKLFDNAMDVTDTIWYSPTETLYDAVLSAIEEEDQEVKDRIAARLNKRIDPELDLKGITYIKHDSTT